MHPLIEMLNVKIEGKYLLNIFDGANKRLVGITSRATNAATHPCGDGGIYTRMDVHLDFIRQVARNARITDF